MNRNVFIDVSGKARFKNYFEYLLKCLPTGNLSTHVTGDYFREIFLTQSHAEVEYLHLKNVLCHRIVAQVINCIYVCQIRTGGRKLKSKHSLQVLDHVIIIPDVFQRL